MKSKNILCGLAIGVVLLMLFLAGGATASAQVVTNTADSGPGTLRSAITNAASGAGSSPDLNLSLAAIAAQSIFHCPRSGSTGWSATGVAPTGAGLTNSSSRLRSQRLGPQSPGSPRGVWGGAMMGPRFN
jgi:hypothetical protein